METNIAVVQVGVVEAFRQQAHIVEVSKAGGSSSGALVAAAMLTGLPMDSVLVQVVVKRAKKIRLHKCSTV